MWLMTPIGFFSIVQKPADKDAGSLTVRARVRGDLEALRQQYLAGTGDIEEGAGSDYRFRATAPRAELAQAMARLVEALDYGNFKAEVGRRQGEERAGVYGEVRAVLYGLQGGDL